MTSDTLFTSITHFVSLFVIACCIFLVSSLITFVAFLIHRGYLSASNYQIKNSYLFFHALCAVFASIVVTIWLSLPDSHKLPIVFEHCHSSNCTPHIPAIIDPTLANLLFAFFVISLITVCFILLKSHQNRLEERINSLLRLSHGKNSDIPYWSQTNIINVPQPVLLNVGMLAPKLLVSSVIIESVPDNDVKLLLAYEYAKAKQFENFKVKLLQIACLFWPAKVRQLLISDLKGIIRTQAKELILHRFGHRKMTIPEPIINQMPKDIREFIWNIEANHHSLPQANITNKDDRKITNISYLFGCVYFICLVVLTSNFTHFLFELIG